MPDASVICGLSISPLSIMRLLEKLLSPGLPFVERLEFSADKAAFEMVIESCLIVSTPTTVRLEQEMKTPSGFPRAQPCSFASFVSHVPNKRTSKSPLLKRNKEPESATSMNLNKERLITGNPLSPAALFWNLCGKAQFSV